MFRNTSQLPWLALVISALLVLPGCPGSKSAPISGYTPLGSVSVMVIVPQSTTVGTGSTQQFTAMINNSGVSGVQWEVNGTPGGDGSVGTIDSSGNYTAPQFVPKNPHVTITALADADNTKSGSANITIVGAPFPATVSISPTTAALQIGTSLTFSATVTGPADTSVTWQVNGIDDGNATIGKIVPGGKDTAVYTAPATVPAPATVEVTAVSNSDITKSASALVTISKNPPNLATVTISPPTGTVVVGHSIPFTGTVSGVSDAAITWEVGGLSAAGQPVNTEAGGNSTVGSITSDGVYTAPAKVPVGGEVTVVAASREQPSRFAFATVTVTAAPLNAVSISLNQSSASVKVGGTLPFTATVVNASDPTVTWYVDNVPNGNPTFGFITPPITPQGPFTYTAPDQVPAGNPVVIVKAVPNADPTISADAAVTIEAIPPISVMVSPSTANVKIGMPLQFVASVSNAIEDPTVTWQVSPNTSSCASPIGSIVTSGAMGGLYTAPATVPPAPCNPVIIQATSNQDHKTFGRATATIVNTLPVQITLSPQTPSVEVNGQVTFTADITNDPTYQGTVGDWQVNGIGQAAGGGNATVGFIVSDLFDTGSYTAPASPPPPLDSNGNGFVTITAVSEADPTKTASTTVTITPAPPAISVQISPSTPIGLLPGQMEQFSANVNGTMDQVVYWTLSSSSVPGGCTAASCGTITPSTTDKAPATYQAPQTIAADLTVTVTATADADRSASASDAVTISENTTLSISVTPSSTTIAAGTTSPVTFNATVNNAPLGTTVDWELLCISLWDGTKAHPNCASYANDGGPGCLEQSPTPCPTDIFAERPVSIQIPADDSAAYTAPEVLYTGVFAPNSCEPTDDGSGNAQVPLTATVSYNGNSASATVCITVTPP